MNPILIKPSGERHSQVVVMGKPYADAERALLPGARSTSCGPIVARALARPARALRRRRLRGRRQPRRDQPAPRRPHEHGPRPRRRPAGARRRRHRPRRRLRLAVRHARAARSPRTRRTSRASSSTSSAATASILAPGLAQIEALTGRPVLGRAAARRGPLDGRRGLARARGAAARSGAAAGADTLDVVVLRLRWMSNFTDLDALAAEPGVRVRFTRSVADVERADLLVVPGTKATVEDLARLRAAGLDRRDRRARRRAARRSSASAAATSCSASGSPTTSSPGRARSRGSACCRSSRRSSATKVLRRRAGRCAWLGTAVERLRDPPRPGRARTAASRCWPATTASPTAAASAACVGTSWHGALEHDAFRRALLRARRRGARPALRAGLGLVRGRARAAARRPRRPRRRPPRHRAPRRP